MIIDFSKLEETVIPRFKGGEKEIAAKMFFDGKNRIMQAHLRPGASIGLHRHEGSCEILFITSGRGTVIFDGQRIPVEAGICHYCPEGHEHSLINDSDEDLRFLAVVPTQEEK